MAKTIAEVLVESLVKAGVRRIHGLVGDSLNAISDVVRKTEGIEWIHYRHEEAAAFAAGAEAQLTGQLAVCAGSCGPGNLHLINGLYDCNRSMAPVLAIAAHIPSGEIGTTYFQETHPERLFQECSQYCELISSARQMPRVLQLAMQYAVGKRGVGVIVLPGDVAMEKWPIRKPHTACFTRNPSFIRPRKNWIKWPICSMTPRTSPILRSRLRGCSCRFAGVGRTAQVADGVRPARKRTR